VKAFLCRWDAHYLNLVNMFWWREARPAEHKP
jgi:hypothetical protein